MRWSNSDSVVEVFKGLYSKYTRYIEGLKIDEKGTEKSACCFFCNEAPLFIPDLFNSEVERLCCSSCFKIVEAFYRNDDYQGESSEQVRKYVLAKRDEMVIEEAALLRADAMEERQRKAMHDAMLQSVDNANIREKALELAIKAYSFTRMVLDSKHIVDEAKHFYDFLSGKSEHFKEDK